MATDPRYNEPSEFGGDPGLVQPTAKGHVFTLEEQLSAAYKTNPSDPADVPDPARNGEPKRNGLR